MRLYELFIGFRYLKAKKNQGFISFNTLLSLFIVFIGVFILIVVISVMNGFQSQIKDKILDVDSHITVMGYYAFSHESGIVATPELMNSIRSIPDVVSANPYFQGQALFRFKSDISPVMIRGVGEKGAIPPDIKKFLLKDENGAQDYTGENGVFIGGEMALLYNIHVGDVIDLIVPKGQFSVKSGVEPGMGQYKVIGFFKTGYYDFDTRLIIMPLSAAQYVYGVGNRIWGVGIKIKDIYRMENVAAKIRLAVGYNYQTFTAEQRNQNLFYALQLEKLIMTVILFLVIIASGFTIMGTLVMVVMEKRRAIGILKAMGAPPNSIMAVFVLEGFLIGVIGTTFGVLLGLATSINLESIIRWIESVINTVGAKVYALFHLGVYFDVSLVPKNVYYIDRIPTEISPEFIVFIAVFAVFLSTISAVFPAWNASRLRPVETIRYE